MELARSFFAARCGRGAAGSDAEAQAEDAVQEALLRLWLMRERVEKEAEALVVRLTKNVCVDEWRRQQRRGSTTTTDIAANRILATEPPPMEMDEAGRKLQEAVATLPESERRLFRMRHELEMDIAEIAAVTGLHPRSISTIISRARQKIIQQLKKGGIL